MDQDQNLPQDTLIAPYAPEEEPSSKFPIKKVISFVIGLIILLALASLFIFVILPRLSSPKNENVTLTYWGVWEDSVPFETIAAEFTRIHPNIKITIQKQDIKALGKYVDRLATRMDNGTGPDIFRFHNSWITELKSRLLPLPQELVKELKLEESYYPVVAKDLKLQGAYMGVPIHFDSLSLFINTEIFNNAGITTYPSTWDDLRSTALELTVKDDAARITTSGVALGTFDNIAHASDIVSLLLIQNGANLNDLNGENRQSAYDALDFYTLFAKGESAVWDNTLENSKLAFANGKLAMYFGYSWDIFEIRARAPGLGFVVTAVPHLPSRDSTIASYWVEGISSSTKHPKEAYEFVKFLASKSSMEKLYALQSKTRAFGELYPRADMAELLRENTLIYPFVEQGGKAVSTMFSSDTHDDAMVDALNVYMGNAVRSIISNNGSSQSAIETLSAGVAQVRERYAGN